jgi:excinuclease ABC, C subunit
MEYIKNKLSLVPNKPGCYQMKNKNGVIIYVGKAKDLKKRLASYFRGKQFGKTAKLVSEIVDFEYIVVGTETESLILELNLIKKYDPKYNILLRDDKTYPYIELTNEKAPRLLVVRNISRKKSKNLRLFGPYPNVTAARKTVNLLNRIYPLRKCTTFSKTPCLYFHIGQCLGFCSKEIDEIKVKKMESDIIRFLKGDDELVTLKLAEEMKTEADKLNFEKAKEVKELLDDIKIILEKQKVELADNIDRDVFGYATAHGYMAVQVFFIRTSKILERHYKIFPLIDNPEEELTRYIAKFYEKNFILPKELLIPEIANKALLEDYFRIKVKKPQKGMKKNLLEMANKNAKTLLEEKFEMIKKDEQKTVIANEELRDILKLDKLDRIELFDNSNLFGSFNVSGMVVFIDGRPAKNEYRKYKITIDKNDDYGTMREVIYRRYFKVLKENLTKPDLIIVDGAKGQINIAKEVLKNLNMDIKIVGLKKDDRHSTNALIYNNEEIKINKKSNLFYYLERMQDEVHNYTINYHKKIRSKGTFESVLDSIEGIGAKRKKELLKKYHSLSKMKNETVAELSKIIPENVAENLLKVLNENSTI